MILLVVHGDMFWEHLNVINIDNQKMLKQKQQHKQ
jgi:hypothetical protein